MSEEKPTEQLNKSEQRALRRQQKEDEISSGMKQRRNAQIINWAAGVGLVALVIGGIVWYAATRSPVLEDDIISRSGFHWHPELTIFIKGVRQEIPPNIGLGAVHKPIHTHDDNDQGIIHMEFQGLVFKKDIMLGQFFENWGKDMRSFGTDMKMIVNGKENMEYENYSMRDNDKIELRFE